MARGDRRSSSKQSSLQHVPNVDRLQMIPSNVRTESIQKFNEHTLTVSSFSSSSCSVGGACSHDRHLQTCLPAAIILLACPR